jgi:hypothetical protein
MPKEKSISWACLRVILNPLFRFLLYLFSLVISDCIEH